jgi:hypothetical protein
MYGSRNDHAGCVFTTRTILRTYVTHSRNYHSFIIIPLSPSPIPISITFSFPTDQKPTFSLSFYLLAGRWLSCLDLCARTSLHILRLSPRVGNLSTSNCLFSTPSPLTVTSDCPTNSTCKPPSRCCLPYYDNLRPAWDIFKTKSTFSVRFDDLDEFTVTYNLNRHTLLRNCYTSDSYFHFYAHNDSPSTS